MDTQSSQSMKRILKKMSALRATLNDNEQTLLDGLIISNQDEVTAHALTDAATAAVTTAVTSGPDEVRAHALTDAATAGMTAAVASGPDEARAQAQFHIVFDPAIEEYRLVA